MMTGYSQELTSIAAIASFILNCTVALIGLTWGLKKIGDKINERIDEHRERFDYEVSEVRKGAGEMGIAIRAKIQEVELYIRDTYVRRDSFGAVMDQFRSEWRGQFELLNSRLERMEKKIDRTT